MPKAILVMDMPESCSMCKFLYEFQGIKKCQLMNVLNNGASRLSQNTFTEKRHKKCPLRELPEKKEEARIYQQEKDKVKKEKLWSASERKEADMAWKITGNHAGRCTRK